MTPTADPAPRHLVFVYGTLKRGHERHDALVGQQFLGDVRTRPLYRMVNLGRYPTIVEGGTTAVAGELWSIDDACLALLDHIEAVAHDLYRRAPIALAPPHDATPVQAYFYVADVSTLPDHGDVW